MIQASSCIVLKHMVWWQPLAHEMKATSHLAENMHVLWGRSYMAEKVLELMEIAGPPAREKAWLG